MVFISSLLLLFVKPTENKVNEMKLKYVTVISLKAEDKLEIVCRKIKRHMQKICDIEILCYL